MICYNKEFQLSGKNLFLAFVYLIYFYHHIFFRFIKKPTKRVIFQKKVTEVTYFSFEQVVTRANHLFKKFTIKPAFHFLGHFAV